MFVAGGLVHLGSRLARVEEVTYARSVLAASVAVVGGALAGLLVGALLTALGSRAGFAGFLAALITVQITALALLLRTSAARAALVWAVGILLPMGGFIFVSTSAFRGRMVVEARGDLKAISEALSEYSAESGGALPARLDALRPEGVERERLRYYVYVSGLSSAGDAGWPVAFEPELPFGNTCVMAVLGGEIEELPRDEFGRRLASALDEARARGFDPVVVRQERGPPAPPEEDDAGK